MRDFLVFVRHLDDDIRFGSSTLAALLMLMAMAAGVIASFEGIGYRDALYFTMITGLTVGYGDIVPTTVVARIVSVLVGLVGLVFFGIVVAAATRALGKSVEEKVRHHRKS